MMNMKGRTTMDHAGPKFLGFLRCITLLIMQRSYARRGKLAITGITTPYPATLIPCGIAIYQHLSERTVLHQGAVGAESTCAHFPADSGESKREVYSRI